MHNHNTPAKGFRTEALLVASTKLRPVVAQAPVILEIRVFEVDDPSFPAPIGAHLEPKANGNDNAPPEKPCDRARRRQRERRLIRRR
jgi:hypothetical protein